VLFRGTQTKPDNPLSAKSGENSNVLVPPLILLGADATRVLTVPMMAAVLANLRKTWTSNIPAEKALLDWIYLGAVARTKIAGAPFDIDVGRLKKARLRSLA